MSKIISDFQHYIDNFEPIEAPLASFLWPLCGGIAYIIIIFTLNSRIKQSYSLRKFTFYHNLFLCLLSLLMFVGVELNVYRVIKNKGLFYTYCDVPDHPHGTMQTGPMSFWMWVFYASKYYEMIDTVILVFKRRQLTVVHVYHHFIVPSLFWGMIYSNTTSHWLLVAANSFIHVIMYYYYMMATLGYEMWWKKYLTQMQIIQFLLDIMFAWTPLIAIFGLGTWDCSGKLWNVAFGTIVGLTFVYLFTAFYVRTYRAARAARAKAEAERVASEAKQKGAGPGGEGIIMNGTVGGKNHNTKGIKHKED